MVETNLALFAVACITVAIKAGGSGTVLKQEHDVTKGYGSAHSENITRSTAT